MQRQDKMNPRKLKKKYKLDNYAVPEYDFTVLNIIMPLNINLSYV